MSIRKAVVAAWRNLIEGRAVDLPRYDDVFHPSLEAQARSELQKQAEELMRSFLPRLPVYLQSALEHVVHRSQTPPTDQLSLMNAVSACYTGLGIANERGGVPSDADRLLYQHLGDLERWLDQDLGFPDGTRYAVIRRTREQLGHDTEHS